MCAHVRGPVAQGLSPWSRACRSLPVVRVCRGLWGTQAVVEQGSLVGGICVASTLSARGLGARGWTRATSPLPSPMGSTPWTAPFSPSASVSSSVNWAPNPFVPWLP